jgi:hypothetical protein
MAFVRIDSPSGRCSGCSWKMKHGGLAHHVDLLGRHPRSRDRDRRGLVISSREAQSFSACRTRPSFFGTLVGNGRCDGDRVRDDGLCRSSSFRLYQAWLLRAHSSDRARNRLRCGRGNAVPREGSSFAEDSSSKHGAKRARCADPVEHGCGAYCLQCDIAGNDHLSLLSKWRTSFPVCATHRSDSSGGT